MQGIPLGTITITKVLTDTDVVIAIEATTAEGDHLPLIDALGMLELGKDSLLRATYGEAEEL